jgi:hypothetical protein
VKEIHLAAHLETVDNLGSGHLFVTAAKHFAIPSHFLPSNAGRQARLEAEARNERRL